MQEWPSYLGRVCPAGRRVNDPPAVDASQPDALQFENFREFLSSPMLNPGAMGRDGGHSDPPARILVDIGSSGPSPLTVDSVKRYFHGHRLRTPHPLRKHRSHASTSCDLRSEGFAQNISCVLKLWRRNIEVQAAESHRPLHASSYPGLIQVVRTSNPDVGQSFHATNSPQHPIRSSRVHHCGRTAFTQVTFLSVIRYWKSSTGGNAKNTMIISTHHRFS